jgi:hypothetical protein
MLYTVHATGLFAPAAEGNGRGPRRADRRCVLTATSAAGAAIAAEQVLVGDLAGQGLRPVGPVEATVEE